MRPVPIGTKGSYALVAQPFHLASQFKDSILPPVFATPMMVLFMENAALNAVKAFLEPGETCVGSGISLKHLAATPVGHRVTAEAEVVAVEGRRIAFKVSARDELELIGEGTHDRVVVNMERFLEKLGQKAKK